MELMNTLSKIGAILTTKQTVEEGALASTKIASAVAALFSGNGEIPIAGIAIATAAVAGMLALIASSKNKYASGGIVQGSLHGDNNIARVNGGEMILNGTQQAKLWNMINSKAKGGETQDIQLVVRGKDLVSCINNYKSGTAKISTSL